MSRLIKEAINQTNRIKDVHRTLMDVSVAKQYEISKPFQKLLNLTTPESKTYFGSLGGGCYRKFFLWTGIRDLQEKIAISRQELKKLSSTDAAKDTIKGSSEAIREFRNLTNSVAEKLRELKAKIQKAKEIADGVSDLQKCGGWH